MGKLGQVRIRVAIEADRSTVLEFCRNTWPGGDYIGDVWKNWVRGGNGRLLVATVDGAPVGIAHGYLQTREVVWLEGLRVHPSYRGHGIAGKLNVALVKYFGRRGAKIARLCTGCINVASQKHAEKADFRVARTFQRLDSEIGLRKKPKITRLRKPRADHWEWLEARPEMDDFGGMYTSGWTWYPLTREMLENVANKERVLFTKDDDTLRSCSVQSTEEERLILGFIAGDEEGIETQARHLRYMLSRRGYGKVRALLPTKSRFVEPFEDLGFTKHGKILVYEKRLKQQKNKD